MKLFLPALAIMGSLGSLNAQEPILDSWMLNTDGTLATYWESNGNMNNPTFTFNTSSDSADIKKLCYDNNFVYVVTGGMTTNMGQFTNPGAPVDQGYTFKFPRNPQAGSGNEEVPTVNVSGVLINGVPIFGLSDSKSWDNNSQDNSPMGQGIWIGEAYYSEGETLDTAFAAHPQQDGAYHSHATPYRFYDFPSTSHSGIVGFANDGFPVYGPYGYANPNDNSSPIVRMESSYTLRSITQRHTLADGTVLNASEYGPDVSATHPLGEYIADYEYINGLGDLDDHNGRWCVTPEYPSGTYCYFVTTDASGAPAFPYYFGETYYGNPVPENNSNASQTNIPGSASCGQVSSVNNDLEMDINVFPVPARDFITINNLSLIHI